MVTEPCPTCGHPRTARRCSACKVEKPLAEFYRGDAYCKPCRLAYMKRYRPAGQPSAGRADPKP